ncbi:shikimate kinase [Clostridium carnis]
MNKDIIFLIGMPGCGKTTIGKSLSEEINYDFCDMDDYIEEISGRTIKELFDISEEVFRDFETRACTNLSKKKGIVISSGGGVIKREKNIDLFKEESIIIFIDRPIEKIISDVDTESRPLLKDGKEKIYNLYKERYHLYNKYCHTKVLNNKDIKFVIDEIKKNLKG